MQILLNAPYLFHAPLGTLQYSWINIPSIYYIINSTPVCYRQSTADNCKASSSIVREIN